MYVTLDTFKFIQLLARMTTYFIEATLIRLFMNGMCEAN